MNAVNPNQPSPIVPRHGLSSRARATYIRSIQNQIQNATGKRPSKKDVLWLASEEAQKQRLARMREEMMERAPIQPSRVVEVEDKED